MFFLPAILSATIDPPLKSMTSEGFVVAGIDELSNFDLLEDISNILEIVEFLKISSRGH
jgi:hypothetical protein